jgi:hypothetical protein
MGTYTGRDRRKLPSDYLVPVRLTHKYADRIDGVNLSGHHVGERLCVALGEARLLIAEGWAEPVTDGERRHREPHTEHAAPDDHERCA